MAEGGMSGCDHPITCEACHLREIENDDHYAAGYAAGFKDAIVQVRRLALMNPYLRAERAPTLLSVLMRPGRMLSSPRK